MILQQFPFLAKVSHLIPFPSFCFTAYSLSISCFPTILTFSIFVSNLLDLVSNQKVNSLLLPVLNLFPSDSLSSPYFPIRFPYILWYPKWLHSIFSLKPDFLFLFWFPIWSHSLTLIHNLTSFSHFEFRLESLPHLISTQTLVSISQLPLLHLPLFPTWPPSPSCPLPHLSVSTSPHLVSLILTFVSHLTPFSFLSFASSLCRCSRNCLCSVASPLCPLPPQSPLPLFPTWPPSPFYPLPRLFAAAPGIVYVPSPSPHCQPSDSESLLATICNSISRLEGNYISSFIIYLGMLHHPLNLNTMYWLSDWFIHYHSFAFLYFLKIIYHLWDFYKRSLSLSLTISKLTNLRPIIIILLLGYVHLFVMYSPYLRIPFFLSVYPYFTKVLTCFFHNLCSSLDHAIL